MRILAYSYIEAERAFRDLGAMLILCIDGNRQQWCACLAQAAEFYYPGPEWTS